MAVDRRLSVSGDTAIKAPCIVATTANITLSGLQTVDGVVLAADDRVLVKDQTTGSENGIYNANTGPWTRALDFDGAFDVVHGTQVLVITGTTYANTMWYVSTSGSITIDTTSIVFSAGPTGQLDGPGASIDNELALFSGTSGNLIKRATQTGSPILTAGVLSLSTETPDEVATRLDAHIADAVTDSDTGTSGANKVLLLDGSGDLPALSGANLTGIYPNRTYDETAATTNITAVIAADDTIPQSTEGTEILSATLTPTSVSARVRVTITVHGSQAAALTSTTALFDGNSNAVAAWADTTNGGARTYVYEYVPGVAVATAFSVRLGVSTSSFRLNQTPATGRLYGGVFVSTLTVEEIA